MPALASNQIRHLRAAAHELKPVVMLGANGLTEAVLAEIEIAVRHHELIKIKLKGEDREERAAQAEAICAHTGGSNVQILGHTLILFLQKKNDSRYVLPKPNKQAVKKPA